MSNNYDNENKDFDRELDEILMGNDYERPKMDKPSQKFTNIPKTKMIRQVFEKNAEKVQMRTYFDQMIERKNREMEERKKSLQKSKEKTEDSLSPEKGQEPKSL